MEILHNETHYDDDRRRKTLKLYYTFNLILARRFLQGQPHKAHHNILHVKAPFLLAQIAFPRDPQREREQYSRHKSQQNPMTRQRFCRTICGQERHSDWGRERWDILLIHAGSAAAAAQPKPRLRYCLANEHLTTTIFCLFLFSWRCNVHL